MGNFDYKWPDDVSDENINDFDILPVNQLEQYYRTLYLEKLDEASTADEVIKILKMMKTIDMYLDSYYKK